MNAREALKRARALGARVEEVSGTGEIRIAIDGHRVVRTQHWKRRKSASTELEILLRKLERRKA